MGFAKVVYAFFFVNNGIEKYRRAIWNRYWQLTKT